MVMLIWMWIIGAIFVMVLTGWAMWGTADGLIDRHAVTRQLDRPPRRHGPHGGNNCSQ
ncbi:hypothetical protein FD19_GL000880 [Lacticaseibacillus thailandensis DSM 22698 = JCM 13996]|uniref:Uncharacterized protein n=1 Tax=Lacticaseibacillus thailandensis DSM 22698 = JCM 13996 TaxID=1423810 RepID=A0A0R2CI65_9LACO|nr:hypothetical protein FD19_GL000880 [Lacticaseibacillus thailandensis DSM 22698 = JCM 13996]